MSDRVDFWNLMAVEKYGAPQRWRWVSLELLGDGEATADMVKGGVYSTLFKSGPRRGRVNFRKPDHGTARTFVIPRRDFKDFCLEWERKTGRCSECYGTGKKHHGWSAATGERFEQCKRCCATGVSP